MPKKPQKSAKKTAAPAKTTKSPVKLVESFIRDLSFECFLPPSGQPEKDREMEFTLSRAIRKEGQNRTCVNIAMQARLSPKGSLPFVVAEMIYENVYNVTHENNETRDWIESVASQETYKKARETMLDMLAHSGLNPPIPTKVDFGQMQQNSNV